ncbi:Irregular chiasm C-roughest protein [Orchesella cincta]|uniref:Irregular chiasm C-roughest protein n=1 Tax=Orchesella cincta TaxID=48709 RepID=A0A1D2N261_ORCCI|nr:Irregular chiasm C-roughest protein [Orchesella cincta]
MAEEMIMRSRTSGNSTNATSSSHHHPHHHHHRRVLEGKTSESSSLALSPQDKLVVGGTAVDDPLQLLFNRCMSSCTCTGGTINNESSIITRLTPAIVCSCSFDHWSETGVADEEKTQTNVINSDVSQTRSKRLSSQQQHHRPCDKSKMEEQRDCIAMPRNLLLCPNFLRRKTKRLMGSPVQLLFKLGFWWLTLHILWTTFSSTSLLAAAESTRGPQHFRRTPDNQTATVGDRVTLACSVENKAGILQWTRDGFGLGTDRYLEGYDRYSMKVSEDEGDFTLEIFPITLEDDAIFQCQVGPGPDGSRELRSANAKLTVEVPTSTPEIIHGDLLQTTEDKEVQLECISRAGKPAAEVRLTTCIR